MGIRISLGGKPEKDDRYATGFVEGVMFAREDQKKREESEMRRRMMEDSRGYMPDENHYLRSVGRRGVRSVEQPEDHYPPMGHSPQPIGFAEHKVERHMKSMTESLDPRLAGVLEEATEVMDNPPDTWAPYIHRGDFAGILKMEGKELITALEARKPLKDIKKELTHTLAALFKLMGEE